MLRPRIIPCLLVRNGGLVKTTRFDQGKYVGDPLNAVRIFNEKQVDELVVLDIDATVKGRTPDYDLIGKLAAECRMPLCYGGGVSTVEQAETLIGMGVEKVALSSAAVRDPQLIARIAHNVGAQSVVVVLDVAKGAKGYEVRLENGQKGTGLEPVAFARRMQDLGAGEIVVNSIDRDGTMQGYDLELLRQVRDAVTLPMSALGGAGSLNHLRELIRQFGIIGAAAGSLFVFKGVYRAVLINYPKRAELDALIAEELVAEEFKGSVS